MNSVLFRFARLHTGVIAKEATRVFSSRRSISGRSVAGAMLLMSNATLAGTPVQVDYPVPCPNDLRRAVPASEPSRVLKLTLDLFPRSGRSILLD